MYEVMETRQDYHFVYYTSRRCCDELGAITGGSDIIPIFRNSPLSPNAISYTCDKRSHRKENIDKKWIYKFLSLYFVVQMLKAVMVDKNS
jgi:hypothetical protein